MPDARRYREARGCLLKGASVVSPKITGSAQITHISKNTFGFRHPLVGHANSQDRTSLTKLPACILLPHSQTGLWNIRILECDDSL
jgi:hypothetical protein